MTQNHDFGALENVLMRERAALLAVDFETLEKIGPEKERNFQALKLTTIEPSQVQRILALYEENQSLILAVQQGLADAREIFHKLLATAGTRVYYTSGMTQDLNLARTSFSQKL